MDSISLAIRLKGLRQKHHLTQQTLGNYLNISKQGYCHYEKGTRTPDFYILEKLASLYNMSLSELLSPCTAENIPSNEVAETLPSPDNLKLLSPQEQKLLNLFSQLSNEEKEDFVDLISIKIFRKRKNGG
ncbi:MAG: helix-turn-helix domain-containing protein [Acetivibrio ethanolgignens]